MAIESHPLSSLQVRLHFNLGLPISTTQCPYECNSGKCENGICVCYSDSFGRACQNTIYKLSGGFFEKSFNLENFEGVFMRIDTENSDEQIDFSFEIGSKSSFVAITADATLAKNEYFNQYFGYSTNQSNWRIIEFKEIASGGYVKQSFILSYNYAYFTFRNHMRDKTTVKIAAQRIFTFDLSRYWRWGI